MVPAGTGINPQMVEPILTDTEICESLHDQFETSAKINVT